MRSLQKLVLSKKSWTHTHRAKFLTFVTDINKYWHTATGLHVPPKLHILQHCAEFEERHRALGLYAESQVESCHASFNFLFRFTHRNYSHRTAQRMRRCLADYCLSHTALAMARDAAKQK